MTAEQPADSVPIRAREERRARRPYGYDEAIARRVCNLTVEGMSLRRICRMRDMPGRSTVLTWLIEHPEFAARYELARRAQGDTLAEMIMDAINDITPWNANAQRVRIDALKWLASKRNALRYGDKVEIGMQAPSPTPTSYESKLDGYRRVAFAMRLGVEMVKQQQQRREPLLLEAHAESVKE